MAFVDDINHLVATKVSVVYHRQTRYFGLGQSVVLMRNKANIEPSA